MQGARSGATETYQADRRGSEHRATPQMTTAVVFQQPARAGAGSLVLTGKVP